MNGLTEEQKAHIAQLADRFQSLMAQKYTLGAKEHGGDLRDTSVLGLLYMQREEVIDSFVYLQTAIDKLEAEDGAGE